MTGPSLKIGDYTVTAFSDGVFETSIDVTVGVDKQMTQRISGKSLTDPVFLSVNAFLVEGRGVRALVDAGTGDTMGPELGKLPENLAAAGVPLDSITHVLLTHIHPDHSNGLIAAHDRQRKNMINARRSLVPYADRTTRIGDGEFLPGIHAMKSPGHTPGHNTWTIEGGGDSLIIWGDTIHMAFMQLQRPEIAFIFDTDPEQAVQSRLRLLDRVAADRTRVAGMHLDFPGFGYVRRGKDRWFIDAD